MAIIDSAAIIHILEGTQEGESIKERYKEEITTTTTICFHEVLADLWPPKRVRAMRLFSQLEIVAYDKDAAEKSIEIEEQLKKKGRKINRTDIFIAGICRVKNMPLITTDKDFLEIEGLKVLMP